jgi:hypothetical protein
MNLLPDRIDYRDYKASDIFGSTFVITDTKVDLADNVLYDQDGSGKCQAYALTAVHTILQNIEHGGYWSFDPEEQWRNQMIMEGRPLTDTGGDNLQNALEALRKNGLTLNGKKYEISMYAQTNINEWKVHLAQKRPIYTGIVVTDNNFSNLDKHLIIDTTRPQVNAHAIAIVGYDDNFVTDYGVGAWKVQNSYGNRGKYKGYFWMPYEVKDTNWLFTSYILFDKVDVMADFIFTDVTTDSPHADAIQFVKDKGLMTGEDNGKFSPDRPMTRREFAIVAQRLYNLLTLK